nr:MAG TPA: hypothetical protein [Caudoviricetes sp.]
MLLLYILKAIFYLYTYSFSFSICIIIICYMFISSINSY